MDHRYFGTYHRFTTDSKSEGGLLLSADNLIGDAYEVVFEMKGTDHIARLKNRFGQICGRFDEGFSRELSILSARGMRIVPILSFVAYTNHPDPGLYWGEMAVIAYDPAYEEAMERFVRTVRERMGESIRTRISFDEDGIDRIIRSDGTWTPSQTVPLPEKEAGCVIMKKRLSFGDKMVEAGRARNKGCYAASISIIVVILVAIIFGIASCSSAFPMHLL